MDLDILELEKPTKYRSFYVPFARVEVERKDLLAHAIEVISVTVDKSLEGMDQFTFVVNNAFDIKNREFIKLKDPKRNFVNDPNDSSRLDKFLGFGKQVKIFMGYLDKTTAQLAATGSLGKSNKEPMFTGMITSFKTAFPSGGFPQITITGYDLSYCMTKNKKSKSWNDKKDSEVVTELAGKYKLKPNVQDSKVRHNRIEQSQETDRQLLEKLAERNGFEFYIHNDKLFFQEPSNDEEGVLTLEWGKGLVSFTPEINISQQISKVEVRGWNVNAKKEIVGTAGISDEPGRDQNGKSGGEFLKTVCKEEIPTHRVRQPVYSQQEANRRAEAILKKRSEVFVKGSGESIGIPEIRPDKNIKLLGLSEMFSKTYYIEKATHTVNSSGYKTTFNVKDTTI